MAVKRKIPHHMEVYGRKVKINVVKSLGEMRQAHGLYLPKTREILLDEETMSGCKDFAMITLIHELFHSLEDRLHLNIPPDLSDVVADAVGTMIVENFDISFKRKKK